MPMHEFMSKDSLGLNDVEFAYQDAFWCVALWEGREGQAERDPKAPNLLDKMVESAGIEPASANPLQQVLHT